MPGRTALLVVAGSAAGAAVAVRAGADAVDLSRACPAVLAAFAAAHSSAVVCSEAGPGELVRDQQAAVRSGALLLCRDTAAAAAAAAAGLPPGQLIVAAPPEAVAGLTASGWAVLVDADRAVANHGTDADGAPPHDAETAAVVAVAALSSWLGAAIVVSRHVQAVRRALDMTASIRGTRPPARAVRGLA